MENVSPKRLWYGVTVPATAFLLQEIASVSLATRLCHTGHAHLAHVLVIAIFVVVLALSISAAIVGYGSWKELHGAMGVAHTHGSREMAALFSLLVGIVLSLGILWSGIATISLDICEAVR